MFSQSWTIQYFSRFDLNLLNLTLFNDFVHILPHTTHPSQFFNVTPVISNSYRNLCNVARHRWDADERKWTNSDNKYYMYTFDFVMHAIVLKVLPSQIKICSLATISLCTSKCSKLVLRHTCKNQTTPRVWVYRIETPSSVIKVKVETITQNVIFHWWVLSKQCVPSMYVGTESCC